jgi:tetratricopeptide (TPR) repeat protein
MGPASTVIWLCLALAAPPEAPPAAQASELVRQGIERYNNLDSDGAVKLLRQALARKLPSRLAAKAHLYLGLVRFDALDTDAARAEFRQAVAIDPAIEAPVEISPKIRYLFDQVRNRALAEPPSTAPQSAEAPPEAVTEPQLAAPRRSHALAYSLGAVGIAAAGFATWGFVEVVDYNNLAAKAHVPGAVDSAQINSTSGQIWQPAAIVLTVVAGLGLAGAVATW